MLLPCLAVASSSDLKMLMVPDSVWGAAAVGRVALGIVSGWPPLDALGLALFCLVCSAIVYAPGPARAGGADVAALITIALFVGPDRALVIAWASCILAVASSFGSRVKYVPFMPYLLCGTCLTAVPF